MVVRTLREAARSALERGAPDAAVTYLRRALAEPPPAEASTELLADLGLAEARAGLPDAVERLSHALELAQEPRRRATAAGELGRALLRAGRMREAVDVLTSAIEELGDARELALRLEAELVDVLRVDVSLRPLLRERLERFRRMVPSDESPAERLLLVALAFESGLAAEPARIAADLAERALADGRLLAAETSDSTAFCAAVFVLIVCDRFQSAQRHLGEALTDARARGSLRGFAATQHFRAVLAFKRGAIRESEDEAGRALEVVREQGGDIVEPALLANVVDALLARGEREAAEAALASGLSSEAARGNVFMNPLAFSRAHLRAARGELREAAAELLECRRRVESWGARNPSMFPWRSGAAVMLARLGERGEARRLAAEELSLARAFGAPRAIGVALTAAGRVDGGEEGIGLLEEAVATLERSEAALEHARALAALGSALRRTRRRAEAREPLRRALDLADGCGATALAERVREELAATGARPRRRRLDGVDALTPSELRVARMAADGLANRDIAQALFVTVKTVEVHLSRAYRKLDVGSREELPRVLGTSGREDGAVEVSSPALAGGRAR